MDNKNTLKIKLFYLPGTWSPWWKGLFPPPILSYGMGVVTAALRKNGYYVEQDDLLVNVKFRKNNWEKNSAILMDKKYVDHCLNRGIRESRLNCLANEVLETTYYYGFDIIGFSILSYHQFLYALLLAEKIKQRTNSVIVFGGAFITLEGESFFHRYDFIDFMIVGDGEVPFLKLLDFLQGKGKCEEIPGLLYRNNGQVKMNSRKFYDIEDMSLPDFNGLPLDLYKSGKLKEKGKIILPYQITSGCTHRCSFCVHSSLQRVRIKSYDKIIKELKEYTKRYQSTYCSFCDWTMNVTYKYMDRLCDLFIENKLNINWDAWARVDNLDEKLLTKMKKAGCVWLRFGAESGSNKILQLMRKDFTVEQVSEILRLTHEIGIKAYIALIVGFPHETKLDIKKTIKFLKENSKYIFGVTSVNIFLLEPKSPICNNPEEFRVENLRAEHRVRQYGVGHRDYFAFDEISGLKWKQKVKQQRKAYHKVLKTVYYTIFTKYVPNFQMPFWLWLLCKKSKILFKIFSKINKMLKKQKINH